MAKDPFGYKTIRQQPTKPPTITEEKASELISTLRTLDTSPVPAIKGKYYIFGWFLDFDPLPFFLGIGTTDAKYDQSFGKDLRLSSDTVPQSEPTININPIHREQSEKGTACISIFEVIKRLIPPPIFSALAIQTEINWNDVIYLHQAVRRALIDIAETVVMSAFNPDLAPSVVKPQIPGTPEIPKKAEETAWS